MKLIEHFLQSCSLDCVLVVSEVYLCVYALVCCFKSQWEFGWLCTVQKLHWKFWWLCVCAYKVVAEVLVALHCTHKL